MASVLSSFGDTDDDDLVVVAIDFGTTFTGYAFSFRDAKDFILTSTHGGMLTDDRVPSVVLLNPDKTLHSFGYEAQANYGELQGEERSDYFYLEHFKLSLYRSQKLSRKSTIKDIQNRDVNALHVFTEAIRYMRVLALKIIMQKHLATVLEERNIKWILTIPAIWTDSARQFMREAATKAGISDDRLRLVLEPEAASLFCQENKIHNTEQKTGLWPKGHKYILADLGGGTADICVHEVIGNESLRELHRASGGDLGGYAVTKAYSDFLREVFSLEVFETFTTEYPSLWFDMIKDFERKKNTFSKTRNVPVNVTVGCSLLELFRDNSHVSLEKRIDNSRYKSLVTFKKSTERLHLDKDLVERFFLPTVNGIVDKLEEIIESCTDIELKTLMLVGGFAESPYVRERIKERFSHLNIILHDETRLAVLKGAVMMGYMHRNIIQRRSRFTYGFSYHEPFIQGLHPESLKVTYNGKHWCEGVFKKIIEKDQIVQAGDIFTRTGHVSDKDKKMKNKKQYSSLWRSNRRNPIYCYKEPGQLDCVLVGVIINRPPAGGWPDVWESEIQLIVGETELTVKFINKTTGQEYDTQVDFL